MATKQEIILELRKEIMTTRGTLYKRFEGYFMESLFKQIHKSYIDRSLGNKDKYGQGWKELAPRTLYLKRKRGKLGAGVKPERRMIETREGERSYRPGQATRRGYMPYNENQLFTRKGTTIRFGSKLKHIRFAEQRGPGRPILTSRMISIIVERAMRVALGKMTKYMKGRYS